MICRSSTSTARWKPYPTKASIWLTRFTCRRRLTTTQGTSRPENLQRGYTLRNLLTLQALDVMITGLSEDQATPEATPAE